MGLCGVDLGVVLWLGTWIETSLLHLGTWPTHDAVVGQTDKANGLGSHSNGGRPNMGG